MQRSGARGWDVFSSVATITPLVAAAAATPATVALGGGTGPGAVIAAFSVLLVLATVAAFPCAAVLGLLAARFAHWPRLTAWWMGSAYSALALACGLFAGAWWYNLGPRQTILPIALAAGAVGLVVSAELVRRTIYAGRARMAF